jgi:hypothetical protein
MTSERKIASNRRNGQRGRGPQTAAGKASSSRNALRHGLAVSLLDDPATRSQVEKLARVIAGAGADDAQLSRARTIAEAQLDLVRIRDIKTTMMDSLAAEGILSSSGIFEEQDVTTNSEGGNPGFESEDDSGDWCTQRALRQLSRLERYERRAISRRRHAMRAFLVVQPFGANVESS